MEKRDWIGYSLALIAIVIAIVVVNPEDVVENLGRWGNLIFNIARYLIIILFPASAWLAYSNRRAHLVGEEQNRRLRVAQDELDQARDTIHQLEEQLSEFRSPLIGDSKYTGGFEPIEVDPTIKQLNFVQARDGVRRLAAVVRQRYPDVELLVGIDSGGSILAGLLGKMLSKPVTNMTIGIPLVENEPMVKLNLFKDRRILLLDDASRSGKTLQKALIFLEHERYRPAKIYTAVLLNIPDRKGVGAKSPPDFYVYVCDNFSLKMPWGTKG